MTTETLTFLRALFEGVEGGFLTLTAIHPDKKHPAPSRHVPVGDEAMLAETLARLHAANAQGWGAYFAVAPRKADLGRWRRGGKADLAALPALFVDVDGDPDAALPTLRGFTPAPSCIVHSGGGLHGYWFIRPTTDWEHANLALQGLASALGGDMTNTAQSLRLPGTRNTKPGRNRAVCRIVDCHPERRYTLSNFPLIEATRPTHRTAYAVPPAARGSLNSNLVQAVIDCLCSEFRGYVKANGYIAALCPCGHCQDFPGSHFNLDPARGIGTCFGRHGRLLIKDLCALLRIDPVQHGGFYA